jgi:hypothetical protein
MKEIITAPTAKIKIPMKSTNCEKTTDKPRVIVSSVADVIPKPNLSLNSNKKSVEATLHVKLIMLRLV